MSITSHIAEFRIVWIVQFVMTGNLQRSDRRKSIWCSSVPYRLRLKARYRQFPSPATCSGTWFPSKSGLRSWCIAVAVRSLCPRSTPGSGWCATQWVSSDSFSWPHCWRLGDRSCVAQPLRRWIGKKPSRPRKVQWPTTADLQIYQWPAVSLPRSPPGVANSWPLSGSGTESP